MLDHDTRGAVESCLIARALIDPNLPIVVMDCDLHFQSKAYDEALAQLGAKMPAEFAALADDRRGDVYLAQGKKPQALAEYRKAHAAMDERAEYRQLVEVKLNALGVDVSASVTAEVKK